VEGCASQPQTWACLICTVESTAAYEYKLRGGVPVCDRCAETIANHYNFARSGAYLTWPNPHLAAVGYRKRDIPEGLRWAVFERDGFACKGCGSRRKLRADHLIPESKGGPTTLENLQTLCNRCNSKKGARHG
jgi:hypothetical protein